MTVSAQPTSIGCLFYGRCCAVHRYFRDYKDIIPTLGSSQFIPYPKSTTITKSLDNGERKLLPFILRQFTVNINMTYYFTASLT